MKARLFLLIGISVIMMEKAGACPPCQHDSCGWLGCACVPDDAGCALSDVKEAVTPIATEIAKGAENVGREVGIGLDNAARETGIARDNVTRELEQAGDGATHIMEQIEREFCEVMTLGGSKKGTATCTVSAGAKVNDRGEVTPWGVDGGRRARQDRGA